MGTERSEPLTSSITIGLTPAEAAAWLGAEAFRKDPSLSPGAVFERMVAVQAEMRKEALGMARGVHATHVRLVENCDEVGAHLVATFEVP